jgi:hypothetical protein
MEVRVQSSHDTVHSSFRKADDVAATVIRSSCLELNCERRIGTDDHSHVGGDTLVRWSVRRPLLAPSGGRHTPSSHRRRLGRAQAAPINQTPQCRSSAGLLFRYSLCIYQFFSPIGKQLPAESGGGSAPWSEVDKRRAVFTPFKAIATIPETPSNPNTHRGTVSRRG